MVKLLLIETSTDICSVALSADRDVLSIKEKKATRDHAAIITNMVDDVLKEASLKFSDLDAVVLSEGPGSYTSLRVGMSTAKGICFALDLPLIAVKTLESMAEAVIAQEDNFDYVCSMIDARRMEVYASLFNKDGKCLVENEPLVLEPDSLDNYLRNGKKLLLCGNGSDKAMELYKEKNVADTAIRTSAKNLLEAGLRSFQSKDFVDLAYFSPNYIKPPNITIAKKRLL